MKSKAAIRAALRVRTSAHCSQNVIIQRSIGERTDRRGRYTRTVRQMLGARHCGGAKVNLQGLVGLLPSYNRFLAPPVDVGGRARACMSFWMSSSAKNNEGTVSAGSALESSSLSPP